MTDLHSRIAALSPEQRATLESRVADLMAARGPAREARIRPRDRSLPTPLGIAQQREWAIERLRSANNISRAFRVEGRLDPGLLNDVLAKVVERHEVLRSTVELGADGTPVQIVHPAGPVLTPVVDLTHVAPEDQGAAVRRHCKAEIMRPFDSRDAHRLRVTLLRLAEDLHVVLFTTDHAASDAWSLSIIVRELVTLYGLLKNGGGGLPLPDIQFGDFAAWQREQFDEERVAAELEHWRETLDGIPAPPELPADRPYPARPSFVGDVHIVDLSAELTAELGAFGERENAPLVSILLAGCSILLHHYLEQDDLVVGSLVSGRNRLETEQIIGCFANPLPLRVRLSGDLTLREVVRRASEAMATAMDHQDVPFERVIELLDLGREASQTSLSRLWINVLTVPGESLEVPGLRITPEPIDLGLVSVDLTLSAVPRPGSLQLQWHYMTELFDRETIVLLAGKFEEILQRLVASPDIAVRQVEPASAPVRKARPPAADVGFVELFQRRVELAPKAPAVVCDGVATGYADLNRAANRLARELRARGVGGETPVGILVERSPALAVAIVGVLKAGGAYVPIDPSYPPERISLLLSDAGAKVLVTQERLAPLVADPPAETVLLDGPATDGHADHDLDGTPDPASLAYIVYTSGSTGRPKGAMIEHRSLVTFARDIVERLGLGAGDRFLQFASPSFDVLVEELFPIWLAGGAVVIPTRHLVSGEADLVDLVERERLTVMELPTAYWHEWVRELDRLGRELPRCLRLVIIGGERVLPERLAMWPRLGVPLMHVYGLTETTVSSTFFRLDPDDDFDWPNLPIGTPLPSADLRVLNSRLAPVPKGGVGELYIGGVSLARGYLGRPGLTAQRFVADPSNSGERLYRTGDLVRLRPDGNLEFISRVDTQIKIRGFRVEPAEIESVLGRHPRVGESVVALYEPVPGDRRLVAYVVPAGAGAAPSLTELRRYLERELPAYMVPSALVELDALPLSPNGKLDRKRLPAPDGGRPELVEDYVAPSTPLQRRLADIVAAVVGVDEVGIHDNFFELGGDSIQAIQVVARAQEEGIGLSPLDFFEQPTIALLAQAATDAGPDRAVRPRPADAEPVLSFDQERLWLEHQLRPKTAYHVGGRYRLTGPLKVDVLEAGIRAIVARHEVLRTTFPIVDGRPVPVVGDVDDWRLDLVDLSDAQDGFEAGTRMLDEQFSAAFDLAAGPLFTCTLVRLSDTEHLLNITSHHVVSDNWSIGLFGRELLALYEAGGDVARADLPELPVQYRDFAVWQRERLTGDVLAEKVEYWRGHLAGAPPAITMPDAPRTLGAGGGRSILKMTGEQTAALHKMCRSLGVTPFMLVLACLGTVLRRWSGQSDIVIGTSVSGRTDVALESLIGCFINTMPLHLDLSGDPDFTELLRRARQVAVDGHAHSDTPFDVLVKELRIPRDPRRTPIFQVVLNVFDLPPIRRIGDVGLEVMPLPELLSSFDLVFTALEAFGAFQLRLEYDAERYQAPMMDTLLEHLRTMLNAVVRDPSKGILDYPLEEAEEGAVAPPGDRPPPAPHLAVERHGRTSDRVAVADRDGEWGYRWLGAATGRIAQALPDAERIRVVRRPTAAFVAAILGCMKAGAAFTVVDTADARDPAVLDVAAGTSAPGSPADRAAAERRPSEDATGDTAEGDWAVDRFGLGGDDRFAVLSGGSAHLVSAMSSAFHAGATLVVPDRSFIGDPAALAAWLEDNSVSVVYLDAPILRTITAGGSLPELPGLRCVFVDNPGELISHDLDALRRLSPDCRYVAVYRTGLDGRPLAAYAVPDDWRLDAAPLRVPLGTALDGLPARLRRPSGRPVATGEVAEICFGGHRTGDLGRRWADGTLEFVGRVR
ncbi:non-ribosomal peptide synthetase [Planomonospora sp. ID82291]|uniref:non-ribosomal peptide synthetase n=1 Tax=Planomonospora sp. ID82291 TaxID=2738136 RepID=UPI0018C446D5|nr:non-ribosomal peptide synthetase [Planomonospora sp. ID82291]MBG0816362.1 amino acid adenylation domain-containing protein [Planomonospora sp. ID82291]